MVENILELRQSDWKIIINNTRKIIVEMLNVNKVK